MIRVDVWDHKDMLHLVEIPRGWRQVCTGALVPGDHYLNIVALTNGIYEWKRVDAFTLRGERGRQCSSAEWYALLIRRHNLG